MVVDLDFHDKDLRGLEVNMLCQSLRTMIEIHSCLASSDEGFECQICFELTKGQTRVRKGNKGYFIIPKPV